MIITDISEGTFADDEVPSAKSNGELQKNTDVWNTPAVEKEIRNLNTEPWVAAVGEEKGWLKFKEY